jgi:flagellar biosynthesis/type III secretory pathway protein FliH
VHAQINWARTPRFLDQEFQQIMRDAGTGRRVVDRLVRLWLRDGRDVWVLVHIEVQGQEDSDFAERMWVYSYRIFDRYHRHAVSIAILTDERDSWRPAEYSYTFWDCSTLFRYPVIKLTDWRSRRAELEASDNPFAVVVLAHLGAQETRRNVEGRRQLKLGLVRRLYERGYSRERITSLFRFIDWLLALPEEMERQVQEAIREFEEERAMPYITSIERMGREQGLTEGREQGLTEGREQGLTEGLIKGREEGKRAALRRIVERRFGVLPETLAARIAQADETTLDALLDRAITATSVDEL